MNQTLKQLVAEFDSMEKTIARQNKFISELRKPTPTFVPPCGRYVPSPCFTAQPKWKLNDCTWAEIAMAAQNGVAEMFFALGDTKTVTLNDGTTLNVRIIGFNHDRDKDGNILPITFETVEVLNKEYAMNAECTNKEGWAGSQLRGVLNSKILGLLPDDLKAVIRPCVKLTSIGAPKHQVDQTIDTLFILSEQEVFGRKIYSIGGEGKWYDWYKQEDTPYGKLDQNGERDWRWLRSPYFSTSTSFCYVSSSGAFGNGASYSNGVSFGFCV